MVPVIGRIGLEAGTTSVDTWTEPIRRYAYTLRIPDDEREDAIERIQLVYRYVKDELMKTLEGKHLVLVGDVEIEMREDPATRELRVVASARVHRDIEWLAPLLSEAKRMVDEDQQWISEQGGH